MRPTSGRVAEHHILHLADGIGSIRPGLVAEVSVRRDGVDLNAQILELRVVIGQILQLGRADEGEILRVEEEDGLVTPQILVVHLDELAALIGVGFEGQDLCTDK